MLIDPPVGPHSSPDHIRDWIESLEVMRVTFSRNRQSIAKVERYLDLAWEWLRIAEEAEAEGV